MSETIEKNIRTYNGFQENGEFFTYSDIIQDLADGISLDEFKKKYPNYIRGNIITLKLGKNDKDIINIYISLSTDKNKITKLRLIKNSNNDFDNDFDFTLKNFLKKTVIINSNYYCGIGEGRFITPEQRNEVICMLHFLENKKNQEVIEVSDGTKEQVNDIVVGEIQEPVVEIKPVVEILPLVEEKVVEIEPVVEILPVIKKTSLEIETDDGVKDNIGEIIESKNKSFDLIGNTVVYPDIVQSLLDGITFEEFKNLLNKKIGEYEWVYIKTLNEALIFFKYKEFSLKNIKISFFPNKNQIIIENKIDLNKLKEYNQKFDILYSFLDFIDNLTGNGTTLKKKNGVTTIKLLKNIFKKEGKEDGEKKIENEKNDLGDKIIEQNNERKNEEEGKELTNDEIISKIKELNKKMKKI